jgi:hypothetical protein
MRDGWQSELDREFNLAETARAKGNDGRARVCARRAAGIAVREYLIRRGENVSSASAYDLLRQLTETEDTPSRPKEICYHLTMRVSEDFKLPIDADLVDESRELCKALLPEWKL